MKTYRFRAEIEGDEDGWFVRCPAMERYGGFAGGDTKEEAWNLIEEILRANIETMLELGMPVPEDTEAANSSREGQTCVTVLPENKPVQRKDHSPKTYQFQVIIEPDEDQWAAYCPALVERGAATCGYTREEAYINIHQVLRMTLETMIAHGETVPAEALTLSGETLAVTV